MAYTALLKLTRVRGLELGLLEALAHSNTIQLWEE